MAPVPNLRVIVDGDSARVYRRGDKVTGRVILTVEQEEEYKSLTLSFAGTCTTKTTRPFFITGNDADATQSRRPYEERVRLFCFEQELLPRCTFAPRKYSWSFDFKFPDLTEPKFSRWQHGPKYMKDPHPLPPSFQISSHVPGGQAMVAYFLQARLERVGAKRAVKTQQMLPYHPTPTDMPLEARVTSRVLYAQTFKPLADSRTAVDRVLAKLSRRSSAYKGNPRIVPTFHYPERISPGQNIPLLLSLTNTQELPNNRSGAQAQCILDSVTVAIGTHTTSICGQPASQPEDTMIKHITCLSKTNLNTPLPFGSPTKLTNNFRLVDDAECIPSFKTYTITRRYDLTVTVGIRYGDRTFTVRCTTLLEILPRIPPELLPSVEADEDGDDDPLPLYVLRDPVKEHAPDYESIYSLSRTGSSLTPRGYSVGGGSSLSSGSSTPATELEEPDLGELPMRSAYRNTVNW